MSLITSVEAKASWSKVHPPAQRCYLEKAGLDIDSMAAPLQLTLQGPPGYPDTIAEIINSQSLPLLKYRKTQEVSPVSGLIKVSHFFDNAPGTDGLIFTGERRYWTLYRQALGIIIKGANKELKLQRMTLLPEPPKQTRTAQELEEIPESA